MSETKKPHGPWSEWAENSVGRNAQHFYKFLDALWSTPRLRGHLFNKPSEEELKSYLHKEWSIVIPDNVRIMLVDIENARMKTYPPKIDPSADLFYVMVIPPNLRRNGTEEYRDAQALSGAWFHATNDSWGM